MAKHSTEILKLFHGELNCDEIQMGKDYPSILQEKRKYYSELTQKLSSLPELAELFAKYKDCEDRMSVEETDAYFAYGFKHGLLLGLEITSQE